MIEGYRFARAGETAVIALAAAHHRLAWIHPFLDGNGRSARLHTHIGLGALGLTHGLWSPMRGLARSQSQYYERLIAADQPRQGDIDGRQIEQRGFLALRFIRMADEKRGLNGDACFASSSHQ
jgi:Fic family protein